MYRCTCENKLFVYKRAAGEFFSRPILVFDIRQIVTPTEENYPPCVGQPLPDFENLPPTDRIFRKKTNPLTSGGPDYAPCVAYKNVWTTISSTRFFYISNRVA